jgi:hypothetical protein
MKALIIVGIVFIVLGSITLMFGGFPINSKTKSIDIGPIETTIKEEKHFPVPPVFSLAAIGAGITLVVLGIRKQSATM